MKRLVLALVFAVSALSIAGCVKKGDINERQPLTADMSAYKTASVEVTVPGSVTNSEKVKSHFNDAVTAKLREKNLFSDVPASGGDVTVKVAVTSVDAGNKGLQAMSQGTNSGDATVFATVELVDVKQSKVIGAFDVSGNSKQNTHVLVGGVDMKALDDTTANACGAAADQIADYLDKHRNGGSK